MESEPLDEVQWRSPEWIQQNNGLRTDNVLEYFSYSPFYDRGSNNQILKMQSQFQQQPAAATPAAAAAAAVPGAPPHQSLQHQLYAELRNMKGTEFVVAIAREPELWVIRKQTRLSPQETRPLSTYFVVGENIYMAPSVHSVVSSRVLSTTLALTRALARASRLHGFSPSQGYFYKNDPATAGYNMHNGNSNNNNNNNNNSSSSSININSSNSSNNNNNNNNSGVNGRNVSSSRQVTPGTTPAASGGGGGSNSSTALLNTNMERIAFSVIDRALGFTIGGTPAYLDDNTPTTTTNNGPPTTTGNSTNLTTAVGSIVGTIATTNGSTTTTAAAAVTGSGNGTGVNTVVGTPVSTPGSTKPNPRRRKKLHG